MWKAGFTKQSIQLNEYALKNEPLYGPQIAAYNLGAIAEHDGDYKQALTLYEWAGKRSRQLEGYAGTDAIAAKSLNELPPAYIERAIADTQENVKLKRQRDSLARLDTGSRYWYSKKHWSSEAVHCALSLEHKDDISAVNRLSNTIDGKTSLLPTQQCRLRTPLCRHRPRLLDICSLQARLRPDAFRL